MTEYKKIVALDLDGVLARYTSYKGPDIIEDPSPEGVELLIELSRRWTVIIHSARATAAVEAWLRKHRLIQYTSGINCCPIKGTAGKPVAIAYIDDRAVPWTGNIEKTLREVERLDYYTHEQDTGEKIRRNRPLGSLWLTEPTKGQ